MRRTLFAFAGALVLTGCGSSTEPNFRDVNVNTSVTPVRGLANHFTVTTTVENEGKHALQLEVSACPRRFRVETLSGNEILLSSQICDAAARTRILAPGESHTFSGSWDGTDANGATLSGEFRIIGQPYSASGPNGNPVTVYIAR